ncbi:MAG: DUF1343 domain-containing protein [Ruminococcaceae bacterium]|nr:DUF1343 domain-containing protein [Oscillospiraceae bacterium]
MKQKVLCGADVLARDGFDFQGKCGLITNHTGVLRNLSSTVDMLKERCNLVALFGPEHGVRGDVQAGESITSYTDKKTALPVYSLYGDGISESEKALTSLDTVIFDIQDVGARFYTYAYTMTDAMKLCAECGIKFIVLDRPNPLGGLKAEGTILDRRFSSFVGRFPTPTRCGLTIGEFALMMNETENMGCDLTVIPMEGWKREMYYDDTDLVFIQPSPNIPTVDTAFAYIGTCIFEETNLSEGRGTTKPFEMIGAPWLDSKAVIEKIGEQGGVILRECSFTPTFSDYKDTFCRGIQLHVTDRKPFSPFAVGIKLLDTIRKTHSEFEIEPSITNLIGTDDIFRPDFDPDTFIAREGKKIAEWQSCSKKWYLY